MATIKRKGKMQHDRPIKRYPELTRAEQKLALATALKDGYTKDAVEGTLLFVIIGTDQCNIIDKAKLTAKYEVPNLLTLTT
jgi:hypothetical protein